MRISAASLVGAAPLPEFIITNKDVEVTDATRGIILKSPNGKRWRITIDNSGTLIRTEIV